MKEQAVIRLLAKFSIPFILLFGLYVIAHGELGPGGGFQGGVILASAFILYALIFGLEEERRVLPRQALEFLAAAGLLLYIGVGVMGIWKGSNFLDYSVLGEDSADAEALGMTLVEWGVGITVGAVMILIFNKVADVQGIARGDADYKEDA